MPPDPRITGVGLGNTEQSVKISLKANLGGEGSCDLGAGPLTPDAGTFKASLTGFASCDTSLSPPPGGLPIGIDLVKIPDLVLFPIVPEYGSAKDQAEGHLVGQCF